MRWNDFGVKAAMFSMTLMMLWLAWLLFRDVILPVDTIHTGIN